MHISYANLKILKLVEHRSQEGSLGQLKMSKKIGDMGFVRLDLYFEKLLRPKSGEKIRFTLQVNVFPHISFLKIFDFIASFRIYIRKIYR